MVTLVSPRTLEGDTKDIFNQLRRDSRRLARQDALNDRYYEGRQRLEHIGLAVPPELRRFETVINVPRIAVDEPERRLDVRTLLLPGEDNPSGELQEGWDANNMDSELPLLAKDTLIFGRGYTTVGINEDDPDSPLIRVESPRAITTLIDNRKRKMDAALRLWRDPKSPGTGDATLYLPDRTIYLSQENYGHWIIQDEDEHGLGVVPVVLHLNRRRTGDWLGRSEMADVIGLTDSIARTLSNMALGIETSAVPMRWAAAISKGDFVDEKGNPLPVWEAYYGGIWASKNANAKFGQFSAADMKNFHGSINEMLSWCAVTLGLPTRYAGQQSANPASEGAIRADEARLVKNVERKQTTLGASLGWTMALWHRLATGNWLPGNRVKVEWHDASTPTRSERSDAIQKLNGGVPVLSQQGSWDEMGWNQARKDREKRYFREEMSDPTLESMAAQLALNYEDA